MSVMGGGIQKKMGLLVSISVLLCLAFSSIAVSDGNTAPHEISQAAVDRRFYVECKSGDRDALFNLLRKVKAQTTPAESDVKAIFRLAAKVPQACLGNDFADSVSELLAWHGLFPCDAAAFSKPVTIVLSGEWHSCDVRAARKSLYEKAKADNLLLGTETNLFGSFADHPNLYDRLDGNEQFITSKLGVHAIERVADSAFNPWQEIFSALDRYPFLRKTWAKVARPFKSPEAEDLAAEIDQYILKPSSDERQSMLDALVLNSATSGKPETFSQTTAGTVLFALLEKFKEDLDDPRERMKHFTPRFPKPLPELLSTREGRRWFLDTIDVAWRDKLLTGGSASLTCKAAAQGKAIAVVRSGLGHVRGTYAGITEMIKRSGLEHLVKVQVADGPLDCPDFDKYANQKSENEYEQFASDIANGFKDFVSKLPKEVRVSDRAFEDLFALRK